MWIVGFERSAEEKGLTCMLGLSVCIWRMRHVVRDSQEVEGHKMQTARFGGHLFDSDVIFFFS